LAGGEYAFNPVFEVTVADVVPRTDAATLVDAAIELNHDLAGAMVIYKLEVVHIACVVRSHFA
jgi:FKBP-type peptidyl-prolyl cis-trans isomerase 2